MAEKRIEFVFESKAAMIDVGHEIVKVVNGSAFVSPETAAMLIASKMYGQAWHRRDDPRWTPPKFKDAEAALAAKIRAQVEAEIAGKLATSMRVQIEQETEARLRAQLEVEIRARLEEEQAQKEIFKEINVHTDPLPQ